MQGAGAGSTRRARGARLGLAALGALGAAALVTGVAAGGAEQASVTLFARPTTISWAKPFELFGAASGARAGDIVRIEQKECGVPTFQTLVETHANAGGGWSISTGLVITSTFRAVFRDRRSAEVTVRQRPNVVLERERAGRGFVVTVTARKSFWRKTVLVQRRTSGRWQTVRRVRLNDSSKLSGVLSGSQATFALAVPRGTLLRAVVPPDQARPCYVSGPSRVMRT